MSIEGKRKDYYFCRFFFCRKWYIKGLLLGIRGGASPHKTLLSTPRGHTFFMTVGQINKYSLNTYMKKITSLKSLDSFLFDVLTKFFFNSQRFQYCGVKGTFLGTGLNYKKTTFRNEKMRPPIYMRLLAPLVIPSSLQRQGVHRVYIEYHDHQNEILKVAFCLFFAFDFVSSIFLRR